MYMHIMSTINIYIYMELAAGSRTWYPSPASLHRQVIFVPNFPAPAEPVVYPTEGEGGPSVQDVSRGAFRADDGLLSGLYFSLYWFQSESNIITLNDYYSHCMT